MKSIKKKVGLIMAGLMVAGVVAATPAMAEKVFNKDANGSYKYETETGLRIKWVLGEEKDSKHLTTAGLQAGYYVVSEDENGKNYDGEVQYKLFYYNEEGNWVSTEWSDPVEGNKPYHVALPEGTSLKDGLNDVSVWVRRAGEQGHFENKNDEFGYDAYRASKVKASKDSLTSIYQAPMYTIENGKFEFQGFDGIGARKTKAHYYDVETASFIEIVDGVIPEGEVLINLHIFEDEDNKWDAYKLFMVDNKKEEATKVEVFTTNVEAATVGSKVTIAMTEAGKKEFANAAMYQVFDAQGAISKETTLGETTVTFPAKVAGDEVVVKLLDAEKNVIKAVTVKLGENGVVVKTPVSTDFEVNATVEAATVGAKVTVNTVKEYEGVVKYQIFDGETEISRVAKLGETSVVFPGKNKGDKVTVKLLNATDEVVGSVEVELK